MQCKVVNEVIYRMPYMKLRSNVPLMLVSNIKQIFNGDIYKDLARLSANSLCAYCNANLILLTTSEKKPFVSTTHRSIICKGELFPLFLFTLPNNNVCSFLIALRLSNLTRELMQLWKSIKTILIFVSHFVFPSKKK